MKSDTGIPPVPRERATMMKKFLRKTRASARMNRLSGCVTFTILTLGVASAAEPDTFSPVVSFQYQDSLADAAASTPIQSPVVSFQYQDSLADASASTTIQSPVVSFQYFEWPGDEVFTFQNSAAVSYYYNGAPSFTLQPQSKLARVGSNVSLTSLAAGATPLSYQWRKNGVSITGATSPNLTFNSAQLGSSGTYSATVSNGFGSAVSSDASFTVYAGPTAPKPNLPTKTQTNQPLATTLAQKPGKAVSAQLRWFNPSTHQFEAVPTSVSARSDMATKLTIIITHGWNDGVEMEHQAEVASGNQNIGWIKTMALSLSDTHQPFAGNINILAWDWGPFANVDNYNPAQVAPFIPGQGATLGSALMDLLGADYHHAIHFIGHSFGCGVNCAAANYVHGDVKRPAGDTRPLTPKFDSEKTHLTLLDEAELATVVKGLQVLTDLEVLGSEVIHGNAITTDDAAYQDLVQQTKSLFIEVIPTHSKWIDNYVSEVGLIHPWAAANVMLFRKHYPGLSVFDSIKAPHGYAYEWYINTINDPSPIMGHRYSFERGVLGPKPAAYFRQNFDQNSDQMDLIETNVIGALLSDKLVVYPSEQIAKYMTAAKNAVENTAVATTGLAYRATTATGHVISSAAIGAVTYSGQIVMDAAESFSTPQAPPFFLSNSDPSTAAYFKPIQPQTTQQSYRDTQFTLSASAPLAPLSQLQSQSALTSKTGTRLISASLASSNSGDVAHAAYMTLPTHVPLEAVGMSFEYKLSSAAAADFMTLGLGSQNIFTLDAAYVDDGVWSSSPIFLVSDHRNQDVQLTFALIGASSAPSGTLSIRNIQFYTPPRPSLSTTVANGQITLSWPISAMDWTLESTSDLSQPNSWQPILTPPTDEDYSHTMTFDLVGPRQFFRLGK